MTQTLNYIQMPLYAFLQLHPEYRSMFPYSAFPDPRYLVRIQLHTGTIEVGFAEDDWEVK